MFIQKLNKFGKKIINSKTSIQNIRYTKDHKVIINSNTYNCLGKLLYKSYYLSIVKKDIQRFDWLNGLSLIENNIEKIGCYLKSEKTIKSIDEIREMNENNLYFVKSWLGGSVIDSPSCILDNLRSEELYTCSTIKDLDLVVEYPSYHHITELSEPFSINRINSFKMNPYIYNFYITDNQFKFVINKTMNRKEYYHFSKRVIHH